MSTTMLKPKRILIVDDDEAIRGLLRDKLGRAGYAVMAAPSGHDALALMAEQGLPHLTIVDLNMPVMGGLEFCARLKQFCDVPIIILTAVYEPETVIKAIEEFAEDYIVKPFNLGELLARLERVLKRMGDFGYAQAPMVKINEGLFVNFSAHSALVGGQVVALSPTETKLLHIFFSSGGRSLSSEFLLQRVWPTAEVYEEVLRVHISRLRKKIEGPQRGHCQIVAERGHGYYFVAGAPNL
ncbi:MAG: response regulator transcription factor [Chloroflexota bacterium]|nr:response regulator transcription factor [Chloroflexota bacterium]